MGKDKIVPCYLQWTSRVTVSNSGISVAEFDASHLYRASLSVTFTSIVTSADTDLSFTLVTELICRHKNRIANQKTQPFIHSLSVTNSTFCYKALHSLLGPLLSSGTLFSIICNLCTFLFCQGRTQCLIMTQNNK
jgi:hypothetical protein